MELNKVYFGLHLSTINEYLFVTRTFSIFPTSDVASSKSKSHPSLEFKSIISFMIPINEDHKKNIIFLV